jgi:hypothetical protein
VWCLVRQIVWLRPWRSHSRVWHFGPLIGGVRWLTVRKLSAIRKLIWQARHVGVCLYCGRPFLASDFPGTIEGATTDRRYFTGCCPWCYATVERTRTRSNA